MCLFNFYVARLMPHIEHTFAFAFAYHLCISILLHQVLFCAAFFGFIKNLNLLNQVTIQPLFLYSFDIKWLKLISVVISKLVCKFFFKRSIVEIVISINAIRIKFLFSQFYLLRKKRKCKCSKCIALNFMGWKHEWLIIQNPTYFFLEQIPTIT